MATRGVGAGNAPASQLGRVMGVTFTMDPSAAILVRDFDKLGVDIRSFREPLGRAIREVAIPSIRKNFDEGGRPAWEPLSEVTFDIRNAFKQDGSTVPLNKTGRLKRVATQINIWTVTQDDASVRDLPDRVWYGKAHQSGFSSRGSHVPARPFIMFQPEDIDKIQEVFGNWMSERLERAGF